MRCRHCQALVTNRAARGLCYQCWNSSKIRKRYSLLAVLGGCGAANRWRQGEEQCSEHGSGEDRGTESNRDEGGAKRAGDRDGPGAQKRGAPI